MFKWTEKDNIFNSNENFVGRDFILSHPNYSEDFKIQTDYSKTQLGRVIIHSGNPIDFLPTKFNPCQN